MTDAVDVVVLGGGPGGYAAALRAATRGLSVVMVEADRLGGTCLHRGCVPSKALLHVGHLADTLAESTRLGLAAAGPGLDVAAAGRFRDGIVDRLHTGLVGLVKARGITTVAGWGRLVAPGVVEVTAPDRNRVPLESPGGSSGTRFAGTTVEARHVVVATGSAAVELGVAPTDGTRILGSDDALRLDRVPASAVVVGGGPVGVELASLWRSLGAEVTIVEALDRLLPLEDPDSSAALARAFRSRGIDVRTGVGLAGAKAGDDAVVVELADGAVLEVDQMLVAVGRRPRTEGIGLAELGVLDDRGRVVADPLGRTAVEGLWAVGDVLPTLALAHAAFAEGFAVADAIAGLPARPVDHALVPRVTYCTPEVASVGLTEPEARAAHPGVKTTKLALSGNARALIETSGVEGSGGHVKLVCLEDGTIVGAHVVGPSATELVGELGLATAWGALADEVAEVTHAHPTLSEASR
ncbi:MAG: dihydrolipoyl dehydrogenase, partial [Acidimicrobiia bacterium]